jgi:hypothetical protein
MLVLEPWERARGARRADPWRDCSVTGCRPMSVTSRDQASKDRRWRCTRRCNRPCDRTVGGRRHQRARHRYASQRYRSRPERSRRCSVNARTTSRSAQQRRYMAICLAPQGRSNVCYRYWRCNMRSPCRPCTCSCRTRSATLITCRMLPARMSAHTRCYPTRLPSAVRTQFSCWVRNPDQNRACFGNLE